MKLNALLSAAVIVFTACTSRIESGKAEPDVPISVVTASLSEKTGEMNFLGTWPCKDCILRRRG